MSLRHLIMRWLGTEQLLDAYCRNSDNIEKLRLAILGLGNALYKVADQQEKMMRNLDVYNETVADLAMKVAALTTVEQSAEALIQGLRERINSLIADNDGIVPTAELQKLSSALDISTRALAAAVSANTAPAPAPAPADAPPAGDNPPPQTTTGL